MNVLVLNSGSSSQKSCLYQIGDTLPADAPACVWEGKIEWLDGKAEYSIKNSRGVSRKNLPTVGSRAEAIERLLESLWSGETQAISKPSDIDVVGHRVVHGGLRHFEPAVVTERIKSAIEVASVFAPLHSRAELQGMEIVEKLLGPVPQIAVLSTRINTSLMPMDGTGISSSQRPGSDFALTSAFMSMENSRLAPFGRLRFHGRRIGGWLASHSADSILACPKRP